MKSTCMYGILPPNKNENKLHNYIIELRKRIDKEVVFSQTDKRIIDTIILDTLITMEK